MKPIPITSHLDHTTARLSQYFNASLFQSYYDTFTKKRKSSCKRHCSNLSSRRTTNSEEHTLTSGQTTEYIIVQDKTKNWERGNNEEMGEETIYQHDGENGEIVKTMVEKTCQIVLYGF